MHVVHQEGQAVYKYAVRKMAETSASLLDAHNLTAAELDCFIPHQANRRIIESTVERLGLPPERVVINIDRFGNTTAATIPLAMQTALDEGRLRKGALTLIASVGAGFTVGACLLRWEI
jgi:3-oxoacyl-[acyl-carrier-protein] synthase-3